jgi:predicted  nucleic acid-binding Zn-ribbon protein
MPHICTRCNSVFHKGEDILKGCPVCGWKKFLFTRKDLGDAKAAGRTTITKAMGVRIPPNPEIVINDERKIKMDINSIVDRAVPKIGGQKEEAKLSSNDNQGKGETKDGSIVESIRITAPGTYELNLPSLFEREELIMAVKEGTYLIDLTSAFRKTKKE